jgi:hypothetical protein
MQYKVLCFYDSFLLSFKEVYWGRETHTWMLEALCFVLCLALQ